VVLQNYREDLLLCAQALGNDLGEPAFTEFIRAEFGPIGRAPHDVLLRIAGFPLRHILTLKFDTSYEDAHPLTHIIHDFGDKEILLWYKHVEMTMF